MLWEVGWGCHRILGVEERAAIMAEFGTGLSQVLITHLVVGSPSMARREIAYHMDPDGGYRAKEAGKAFRTAGCRPKKVCWIVLRFFAAT